MKNIKRNHVTGAVLVLAGIFFLIQILHFKKSFSWSYPGPRAFPMIAVTGFIVCGLGIFFEGFSKNDEKPFLDMTGWYKVTGIFLITCLYIFAMKYFGYLVCTPFAVFIYCTLIAKGQGEKPGLIGRILYALIITAVIYLLYVTAFHMKLPRGLITKF